MKGKVAAEIVPRDRAQQAHDFARMVEQLVERKVADATHGGDSLLQPWFQNVEAARAIKRLQTVSEQRKWIHYFEDWGCVVCASREDVAHRCLGMCDRCYRRTAQRLRATLRRHAPAPDQPHPTFMDTVRLAREALGMPDTRAVRQKPGTTRRNRLQAGGA